ncbi:MAG: DAK2 domain-containing protein, partial [Dehalococcoidia bacterium]|nr:DAK2 domain-containing protein [Dehalococcoidia bacterium]
MGEITSLSGRDVRQMFRAATRWLERSARYINSLNVFPVPDGDTGINMLLTMRAAMDEATRSGDTSAASVTQAMAKGSLMGARGNSGVILSQILRGLASGCEGKDTFRSRDLAEALRKSVDLAYRGMSKPVEGTILTVIREVAESADKSSESSPDDILAAVKAMVEQARVSVEKTPTLLPVLRQAGVVDAGGQGLYVILEGALRYLLGQDEDSECGPQEVEITGSIDTTEVGYGYCTEFLLEGSKLDIDAVRRKLNVIGDSVLVVGDESRIRVHIHTLDPGAVLSFATSLGTLRQIKVDNMDEQHRDFVVARPESPASSIATVAVAHGDGLIEVLYSIGANRVVHGGETMNPSVQDLLQAVELVPANQVILLPNNPNILHAARQVPPLTEKDVQIVPTTTIPQGVTALLAFNQDADLKANVAQMEKAISAVRSGEITRAVRSMSLDGMVIREGQAIAFLDGRLVAADDSVAQAVLRMLRKVHFEQGGLLTVYYGADADSNEAEKLAESIRKSYPAQEVEVIAGGQ